MSSSILLPHEMIINDNTPGEIWVPGKGLERPTGLELRNRKTPFGAMAGAPAFPAKYRIPRSEWEARIKEKERLKANLSDLAAISGLPCKAQNPTNYCWVFAPTYCVELLFTLQGQGKVQLSPASAGGPIKNWRNVGGWGEEALAFIIKYGLVPSSKWPDTAIDKRLNTPANRQLAMDYRVTEWWELQPGNLDELISCLLRGWPVAVGYNWWGHEVTAVEAVWVDGEVAIRIRNSWGMGWGAKGYSILQGHKMLPDDAVSPRLATAA